MYRIFTFILFVALLFGCRPAPYASLLHALGWNDGTVHTTGSSFTLTGHGHILTVTPGTRTITLDGASYYLHTAAGATRLSAVDITYLKAALTPTKIRPRSILIDPGHGGKDSGCRVGDTQEQHINHAIASALAVELIARGYTVHMTRRDEQTSLTLDQRTQLGATLPIDLFISIHANATANVATRGIETYTLPAPGTHGTMANSPPRPYLVGHAHLHASTRYAVSIHQALLKQSPSAGDRGVRHAHFKVLRDTPAPAILIETGFVTNSEERARLTTPAEHLRIAKAIADGIDNA